jgi:hypothetical protein
MDRLAPRLSRLKMRCIGYFYPAVTLHFLPYNRPEAITQSALFHRLANAGSLGDLLHLQALAIERILP